MLTYYQMGTSDSFLYFYSGHNTKVTTHLQKKGDILQAGLLHITLLYHSMTIY